MSLDMIARLACQNLWYTVRAAGSGCQEPLHRTLPPSPIIRSRFSIKPWLLFLELLSEYPIVDSDQLINRFIAFTDLA